MGSAKVQGMQNSPRCSNGKGTSNIFEVRIGNNVKGTACSGARIRVQRCQLSSFARLTATGRVS